MPGLNLDTDINQITERLRNPDTLLVACLCAEWCSTCRDYRTTFDRLAELHPEACFVWIDIETHADRFDHVDVDNFPTILLEDAHAVRFFGTVLPHMTIIQRMLSNAQMLPARCTPPLRGLLKASG